MVRLAQVPQAGEIELPFFPRADVRGVEGRGKVMAEELVGHAQNHEDGIQLMHQALAAASMQSVAEAEVEVDVPEGLKTADTFNVLFEGGEYELEVPKGMKPGQTMRVKLKDDEEDESLLRVELDVPADFQTGDAILVERDGEEFEVMLPEDVKPGEQVSVTLEEVKPRTTESFNNSEGLSVASNDPFTAVGGPLQPVQEESMQQTFATSLFSFSTSGNRDGPSKSTCGIFGSFLEFF
eukprot:symbB.v1.2.018142.t1/scaffold1418.1/size119810/2